MLTVSPGQDIKIPTHKSMSRFFKIRLLLFIIAVVFPTAIFAAGSPPSAPQKQPVRVDPMEIESEINATAYVVLDRTTGKILTVKNENLVWPIASITKLMTAKIVYAKKLAPTKLIPVLKEDDVGGAKLYVNHGDKLSVTDLFYATLVGSANNAANALARATGLSRKQFLGEMNAQAKALGLKQTVFVDPSGIETGNVSTALEMTKIAGMVFSEPKLAQYADTSLKSIRVANTGVTKKIKSTNWMLTYPEYDSLYVTSGKTGYLNESKWNFVTTIRPGASAKNKELLVVLFGSDSRDHSFKDTKKLVEWAWNVYEW